MYGTTDEKTYHICVTNYTPGVHNMRPAGRMRPARPPLAARQGFQKINK